MGFFHNSYGYPKYKTGFWEGLFIFLYMLTMACAIVSAVSYINGWLVVQQIGEHK